MKSITFCCFAGIGEKGLNYHACRKEFTSLLLSSSPSPGPLSFGLTCLQQVIRASSRLSNTDTLIHLILASLEGVQIAHVKPSHKVPAVEQAIDSEKLGPSEVSEISGPHFTASEEANSRPSDQDPTADRKVFPASPSANLHGQEADPEQTALPQHPTDAVAVDLNELERKIHDVERAQRLICEMAWGSIQALKQGNKPAYPDGQTEINGLQSEFDFTRVRPRQLVRLLAVGNIDMGHLRKYVQETSTATPLTSGDVVSADGIHVIGISGSAVVANSTLTDGHVTGDRTTSHSASPVWPPITGEASPLSDVDLTVRAYLRALVARKAYPAAVALMQQLKISEQSSAAFLIDMVERGQINLAADWSKCLGMDSVRGLVEECNSRDNFKASFKIVERLRLEQQFPDAYLLYRRR